MGAACDVASTRRRRKRSVAAAAPPHTRATALRLSGSQWPAPRWQARQRMCQNTTPNSGHAPGCGLQTLRLRLRTICLRCGQCAFLVDRARRQRRRASRPRALKGHSGGHLAPCPLSSVRSRQVGCLVAFTAGAPGTTAAVASPLEASWRPTHRAMATAETVGVSYIFALLLLGCGLQSGVAWSSTTVFAFVRLQRLIHGRARCALTNFRISACSYGGPW